MNAPDNKEGERRLAAIMFTDMVGYTALAQRNEALALRLLGEQRDVVRACLAKQAGREIDTIGDGFLVMFPSSLAAVRCAVEIQSRLASLNAARPQEQRVLLRIGIHLGDVIQRGGDVAGDAVNVASRIQPLAWPGGICVTAAVRSSVISQPDFAFESMGKPDLKNVSQPVEVFRIAGFGESNGSPSVPARAGSLPKDRIAILPFTNISRDSSEEYFADGMTEELISTVSHAPGLRVIARTSVMRYKGTSKPILEIGRELNVGSVLEGSVRKAGDKLRISVQLIETANEEPRWSENYDRELKDIFAIQSDIARRISEELQEHVLGVPHPPRPATATRNTKAYVDYLAGRQLWNKRTQPDLERSIGFFGKAIQADGGYARAYAGLADSYAALALLEFMPPREAYPRAAEAIQRALDLDPELDEAHTSLGVIKFQYNWDWSGAGQSFRRAIDLNPNYAPAHQFYADLLKALGRFDDALEQVRRAQELDPLSLAINTAVGHVLYLSRQYDAAIEQYQRAVEIDPAFMMTHIWFGRPFLEKGMFREAISELETAVRLSGEGTVALGMLGHGLASAGRREEALGIIQKLQARSSTEYVPSYYIAIIYNGLQDRDQTIAWLRRAFEDRSSWLVWANVEPRFDWLRPDPEFAALMQAMKFPAAG